MQQRATARSSKRPPRTHFIKWLLAGAAAAVFAYIFLFPSQQPSGSGPAPAVSQDAAGHVYVSIAVPVSRDDASKTEIFALRRPDHLWNAVSEFCVRAHAAGAASPSWPWPSLQALLQTVHDEAVKAMGAAVAADAERAYLHSLEQQGMTQVTFGNKDGRRLSVAIIRNEERGALRQRAARFVELHGFNPNGATPGSSHHAAAETGVQYCLTPRRAHRTRGRVHHAGLLLFVSEAAGWHAAVDRRHHPKVPFHDIQLQLWIPRFGPQGARAASTHFCSATC